MNESKEPKLNPDNNDLNPFDDIEGRFRDLGIEIDQYSEIAQRLFLINGEGNSHFNDSAEIEAMINSLSLKFGIEGEELHDLRVAALMHDIGKAGPDKADEFNQLAISELFQGKGLKIDPEKTTIDDFFKQLEAANGDQNGKLGIVKDYLVKKEYCAGSDLVINFFRQHVDWTHDVLKTNQESTNFINDNVVTWASSHHILEGKDPAQLGLESVPRAAKILELTDKYQAYRERSTKQHQEVIKILKTQIEDFFSSRPELDKAKNEYLKIVDILDDSEDELTKVLKEANPELKE